MGINILWAIEQSLPKKMLRQEKVLKITSNNPKSHWKSSETFLLFALPFISFSRGSGL